LLTSCRWWSVNRSGFLETLFATAKQNGVNFLLGAQVKSIIEDSDSAHVHCDDGRIITADLVLGADGINSTVRRQIDGLRHITPKDWDEQHFLCTVQNSAGLPQQDHSAPTETGNHDILSFMLAGKSMLAWIGASPNPMQLDIAISGGLENRALPGEWTKRVSSDILRGHFADASPTASRLVNNIAPQAMTWSLADLSSLTTWSSPSARIVLGGDAAHAMLPHCVGGPTSAIEDAAVLAEALSLCGQVKPRSLQEAIRIYEHSRNPRATRLQELSRSHHGFLSLGGDAAEQRNIFLRALEAKSKLPVEQPEEENPDFPAAWLYGFDSLEEVSVSISNRADLNC
jgi:salicylate hydroxylase